VLTDLHLHLRPDDPGASAAAHFTPANVARYREAAAAAGVEELGVSEHVYRFTDALSVWDHELWRESARDDLAAYCEFALGSGLRLGIEMDFVPGREDAIANLLDRHPFDYVVGSVHFVAEGAVDHPDFDAWQREPDPDRLWARYFATLAEAARSGLFDVLAHPDLVKVWGAGRPAPRRDPRFHYEPAVEAIAESGVAVEVSTAGLRKTVGELYPSDALAAMCIEAGAVFALSSDAHEPAHVGYAYDRAVESLRSWGVERIAVFEGRERRLKELG
jgi:histidinol-phosphatase (PHP family)